MPRGQPNGPQQPYSYQSITSGSDWAFIKEQIEGLMTDLRHDLQNVRIRSEATGMAPRCAQKVFQVFQAAVERSKVSHLEEGVRLGYG
jgi:hypothetical protein